MTDTGPVHGSVRAGLRGQKKKAPDPSGAFSLQTFEVAQRAGTSVIPAMPADTFTPDWA